MEYSKAYKGFNTELKCRDFQYEPGEVYKTDSPIKVCRQGFHFCWKLSDVFDFYPKDKSKFAEVYVLGDYENDIKKSVTNEIHIERVLTPNEVERICIEEKINLPLLHKIQESYNSIIGGSIALYLHGIYMDRLFTESYTPDYDLIFPYYQKVTAEEIQSPFCEIEEIEELPDKNYGNDFDNAFNIKVENDRHINVDVKIDPYIKYDIIYHNGLKFKVNKIESIINAKSSYAMKGDSKHEFDLNSMLNKIGK